jgi:hypothetical protein
MALSEEIQSWRASWTSEGRVDVGDGALVWVMMMVVAEREGPGWVTMRMVEADGWAGMVAMVAGEEEPLTSGVCVAALSLICDVEAEEAAAALLRLII